MKTCRVDLAWDEPPDGREACCPECEEPLSYCKCSEGDPDDSESIWPTPGAPVE